MNKRGLSNPGHPEFKNKDERLSVTSSEGTDTEVTKMAIRWHGIYSIAGLLAGLILVVFGVVIVFTKDSTAVKPVIDNPLMRISAESLSTGIVLAALGVIIIIVTRFVFKSKK